ncbi:hypothetical protein Tco_0919932, partial [Tanacetum coccineum]
YDNDPKFRCMAMLNTAANKQIKRFDCIVERSFNTDVIFRLHSKMISQCGPYIKGNWILKLSASNAAHLKEKINSMFNGKHVSEDLYFNLKYLFMWLMAMQRMGIVDNYQRIHRFSVATVAAKLVLFDLCGIQDLVSEKYQGKSGYTWSTFVGGNPNPLDLLCISFLLKLCQTLKTIRSSRSSRQ